MFERIDKSRPITAAAGAHKSLDRLGTAGRADLHDGAGVIALRWVQLVPVGVRNRHRKASLTFAETVIE